MPIQLTITADDENDFRRQLMRVSMPYLEGFIEAEGFTNPEPEVNEVATAAPDPAPDPVPETPKRTGRPRGSTNKPKTNGNGAEPPPQTETEAQAPPANGPAELLTLAEQIQLITDAAHDQPDKFKPLLVPLRDKLGVQYVSKALEKDRPVLQSFINDHGLAV